MGLEDAPFCYQATKSGLIQISYKGKVVTRLKGKGAQQFLERVEYADNEQQQMVMAKATGHFKHGNERQ